jgi:hypothetical protein
VICVPRQTERPPSSGLLRVLGAPSFSRLSKNFVPLPLEEMSLQAEAASGLALAILTGVNYIWPCFGSTYYFKTWISKGGRSLSS